MSYYPDVVLWGAATAGSGIPSGVACTASACAPERQRLCQWLVWFVLTWLMSQVVDLDMNSYHNHPQCCKYDMITQCA